MNTKIDLSVCIVSWNSSDKLRQCLHSIYKHSEGLNIEVIVFDNASSDGTSQMVECDFPQVLFIANSTNIGFSCGNNIAINKSKGDYILLLNPDIVVLEPCFKKMISFLIQNEDAGLVGCRLVDINGLVQKSCFRFFPTPLSELIWGIMAKNIYDHFHHSKEIMFATEVAWLIGGCMLFKGNILKMLEGFDNRYFMYGEDVDICYRLNKMGLRSYYLPEVKMLHYHGASSQKQKRACFSTVMQKESVYKFMVKNYGLLSGCLYRVAWTLSSFLRVILLATWTGFCAVTAKNRKNHFHKTLGCYMRVLSWCFGNEKWVRHVQE